MDNTYDKSFEWGISMIEMYVQLIVQGKRSFIEVPEQIKHEVQRRLIELNRLDLLDD